MRQAFLKPAPFEELASKYLAIARGHPVEVAAHCTVQMTGQSKRIATLAEGLEQIEELTGWLRAEANKPRDDWNNQDVLAMLAEVAANARRAAEDLNLIGRV